MRDLSAFTLVLITVVFGSFGALMIYGILAGAKKDLNLGVLVVGFSFLYLAVAAVWAMATRKRRGSARR
jgi:energy-converting hydrogenase Eha subunit E